MIKVSVPDRFFYNSAYARQPCFAESGFIVYLDRQFYSAFMPRSRKQEYTFTASLEEVNWQFMNTIVRVPDAVIKALPEGRVRVKGTFNEAPIDLAIQYKKEGFRYFSVSAALRKAAKIKPGDRVEVRFTLADANKVDMPEEMEAVLAQDDEAAAAWRELTPGMQRSLLHYINSVKNVDSRISRALFMANKVKTGQLQVQINKKAKKTKKAD